MDKKNTIIGITLLIAAFASLHFSSRMNPPPPPAPEIAAPKPTTGSPVGENTTPPPSSTPLDAVLAPVAAEAGDQLVTVLENDCIRVEFTNYGGAIRMVSLKQYPATVGGTEPYVFNSLHFAPALSFIDTPGMDQKSAYALVEKSPSSLTYRTTLENGVEVTRTYRLTLPGAEGEPYLIRHETSLRNTGSNDVSLQRGLINLGTAAPVSPLDTGYYLNVGCYDGKSSDFIKRDKLQGGSFMGFGRRDPIPYIQTDAPVVWASVKNQFFTAVLTPDKPGIGIITRRVELTQPDSARPVVGITGNALFDLGRLAAGGSTSLGMNYYVGPKEFHRLQQLGHKEDLVMQFGFWGFFSKILLTVMHWMHGLLPNWGVAIILTTLALRAAFVPLTLSASRSSKRMAKIQPEMQALREKYKDSPQKMQVETLELFKKYKINPLGGCMPIVVTIPFFFGFFTMLQSASELRFASFLWAADLSAPDTVARIWGFPLNIMPLLMGVSSIIQMRLTPTPSVDNFQTKMIKFMPYLFVVFCYNYSCGLAIYWTISNLFSIGQQLIINRMPEPELVAAGGGKPAPVASPSPAAQEYKPSWKRGLPVTPKKKK